MRGIRENNDGDNHSEITRSITDNELSIMNDNSKEDSLLRTTFMGPKDGTWCGNCIRMWSFTPPTQFDMKKRACAWAKQRKVNHRAEWFKIIFTWFISI